MRNLDTAGPARAARTRFTSVLAAAVAGTLLAAGCSAGGSAGGSGAGKHSSTLTIGHTFAPTPNLDPGNGAQWYGTLAYDPLVHQAADGSLHPRLATSWKFVGEGNKRLEMSLRDGVRFADGSRLTASTVKESLDRFRSTAGLSNSSQLANISRVSVVDRLRIRISLSKPDPALPVKLSELWGGGAVVSKAALKDPKKLSNLTFGTGPYVLDRSGTVAKDHYTYKPNPHYWNKSRIHWKKIVIKVLPNANSALSALKSGQVDVISGQPSTDAEAKSAGLRVVSVPQTMVGIALADRAGKVLPALKDVRVRQALNYAIDRKALASGLVATYSGPTPTDQLVLPGGDGHNNSTFYRHDPAKAKRLLRQAGYAKGFSLPVVSYAGVTPLLQAVADQYKAIGVTLKIRDAGSNSSKYFQDVNGGKYPAYGITFGQLPVHLMGPLLFLKNATPFNPFHSSDARVESLYTKAAAANPRARADLDKQLIARLAQQAWFVPVLFQPVSAYARKGITGVQATRANPIANPLDWKPAD